MFFFPFQVDLRLFRLPVLTVLIMLLCTLIYYDQSRSMARWNDAIGFACAHQEESLRWLLQQEHRTCPWLAQELVLAHDPQAALDQLIDDTAGGPYSERLGGRDDIAQLLNGFWQNLRNLGGSPPLTSRLVYRPDSWNPWRAITSSLAHGSWGHLIGNMIFFYLFGSMLEAILGPLRYLAALVGLALGTCLVYSLVNAGHHGPPTLGLSGVIYGVMSLFAWFMPEARIRSVYWFLMRGGITLIPAWLVVGWYVAGDIYSLSTGGGHGVNLVAHVSGAILGYLAGPLLFQGRKDWLREETKGLLAPDY
jgi:membrane associated rhomboid family serine protease